MKLDIDDSHFEGLENKKTSKYVQAQGVYRIYCLLVETEADQEMSTFTNKN
jgi:hypothetical protein